MVFNTGSYTVLSDNSILITANMQSETGFPSSHQLKDYVAYKSRLKLAARAVLSADAGLLVIVENTSQVCFVQLRHISSHFMSSSKIVVILRNSQHNVDEISSRASASNSPKTPI